MWVFHYFFYFLDPRAHSAVHVRKNLAFFRCRSCSSSKMAEASASVFCCFFFAHYLGLYGDVALKLLKRRRETVRSDGAKPLAGGCKPFYQRGQQRVGCKEKCQKRQSIMWFLFFSYVEGGSATCMMSGFCSLKVSHGEGGACIHLWLQHCLRAGKGVDIFSRQQATGSSMTILVCFCLNPNPQLSKYVARGRLLWVT